MSIFPLIWLGGTVTTYDAGMSVPDWPKTYDHWFYPIARWLAVWDVFLEHGHRLLAASVGLLAVLLMAVAWRCDGRKWIRWVAVVIVLGVASQGVLGGLRVWADDRLLARIHGCSAPLVFSLCAAMVAWTAPAWQRLTAANNNSTDRSGSLSRRIAWLAVALLYLEIVFGSQLRRPSASGGFGLFELWIWMKVINAVLIVALVGWLTIRLVPRGERDDSLKTAVQPARPVYLQALLTRRAVCLTGLLAIQLLLAAITWVCNYGWPAWFTAWIYPLQSGVIAAGPLQVLATTAHVAVGSLTLVASLSLALWLSKREA